MSHQVPLSMLFPSQEYWSGLPFPLSGDLPDPGIEPRSPTLQADALPSEPLGGGMQIGSAIQFSAQSCQTLRHHGLQHARPPCPSRMGANSNSCPFTNGSLLKLMSIESVKPFNHLILRRPLLLPPSIFLSIRVISNDSALRIR